MAAKAAISGQQCKVIVNGKKVATINVVQKMKQSLPGSGALIPSGKRKIECISECIYKCD